MGYISNQLIANLGDKERMLVYKMWNVLVQSYKSEDMSEGEVTNMHSFKRFIFVIEGLPIESVIAKANGRGEVTVD